MYISDRDRSSGESVVTGKHGAILCQLILVLLCLGSYYHALNGEFVFDDTVAIVKNVDVTGLPTNLSAIFHHDFWGASILSKDSHKSYRPLVTLMFHMEYSYMGLQAKHMKIINLLLHCINTVLVWKLLRTFEFDQSHNIEQVAIIAAALFAIHPVHTEAVCGIVGRAELMFCLIYLLALLTYRTQQGPITDALVLSLTAVGILFKETAITIPLACVFLDYFHRKLYLQSWKSQIYLFISCRNLTYSFATALLLLLRLWIQNFESPTFKPMDNPVAFSVLLTKILSQHYLYVVNFWILLCPQWLSFDWALGCIELITNIWDLRLQSVLALYSVIAIALINFKYNMGFILGLGLIVIPFLPASGIIKVGFVIAERVLYVPSIGFCFMVASSFVHLHSIISRKWWLIAVLKWMLMLVFASFLMRTRQRSSEWLTEQKLFLSALRVCPKNAKVHYNIARLATDMLQREKAFHHYHKAIELFPQYESALMNLGNLYRETGDQSTAEQYIKMSLAVLPEFPTAWMNLGIVQSAQKKYSEALQSYKNALKYRKNYAICHYNLGNLYLEQKLFSEAMHHWQEAVALSPRQPKAWANILTMLDNRGLYEDALRLSERALEHLPNETSIMFIRANVFGKLEHYVEAETLYKNVIKADPINMLYYTNLGILYHRWDKVDAAIYTYKQAIQLDAAKAITARDNLRKLLKRIKQEDLSI